LEEQFWGPFGGICTRRRNAADLCAARSSGRLRYRLDPHHPALGSGNTEGRIVRRCLHDDHTNNGKTPDRVSCVSSDASAQCQIHTMAMEDGVMKMRPVEGGLEIKPGETVMLKPSSFHVMLVNLKHPLQQGKMVKATLKFENAGTINVEYPVAAIGAAAPGAPASEGGMKMEGHGGMKQMDKH
jgi:copper(I)-binding protein